MSNLDGPADARRVYHSVMHPILDLFESCVQRHPQRPAAADQSLALEYAAFRALACGLSAQIDSRTSRPHVGVLLPSSSAAAVAIFACWYSGRTPVPLNFLLTPPDLGRVIQDAGIDLVLTIDMFQPLLAALGVTPLLLKGNTTLVPGERAAPAAAAHDLAAMIYTSGTSGDPKGVRLTFDNLVQNAQACIQHMRMTPEQVFLGVLPQFHSFGFTAMTVVPLTLGASVHYVPRFSPAAIVHAVNEHQVSVFMAVASMFAALTKLKTVDASALRSLQLVVSGGEPLPLTVAQRFAERFGVEICEGYGLTETSPVVSINQPWNRRLGSVGTPLPGVQISTVDPQGSALPPGGEGEIVIRGHCVMQGYHNKPEATAAVVRANALYTGDIGRVDEQGFVHITGRAKEMLIIGGENVAPREIENALCEHPAVAEAAVIGVPDDLRGELPLAYVILHEGASATEAELRGFCRDRIATFKVPREIRIATDLPRGTTGKILKRALPRT